MSRKLWTKEEAEKLINYYKTHSIDESIERYGYASANSLRRTINELHKRFDISKERKLKWDEEKARELVNFYATHTAKEVAEKYEFSTADVAKNLVYELSEKYNIPRDRKKNYRKWTEEKARELIEFYLSHSSEETAEKYGFPSKSISSTLSRLSKRYNIPMERKRKTVKCKWTEEKAKELISFYEAHTAKETAEKYGFISAGCISPIVNRLSEKYNIPVDRKIVRCKWTEEKAHEFIEFYNSHSVKETAEKYGYSESYIGVIIWRLKNIYGTRPQNKRVKWTEEKARELIEFYLSHSSEETAEKYEFSSKNSINSTLSRLSKRYSTSMERKTVKCKWTEEKAKELIEFYLSHSTEETMERYNFSSRNNVYRVINRLSKRYNIARK